ncbi:hypothetical protein GEOBRER4_n0378 [Citrifermentans bremense]|uniref:Uncharacterized protein n=1 Tax=Citrifermentans bremense TaxID=60035 RepID=A0A7R7IZZ4_9BACT|nr:hypothetical protein GEOBRER4_n0378 [Citrifermentans bremense]
MNEPSHVLIHGRLTPPVKAAPVEQVEEKAENGYLTGHRNSYKYFVPCNGS